MNATTTKNLNNDTFANRMFNSIYNAVKTEMPFNTNWRNGTGYFNGAVQDADRLVNGQVAKSYDPGSDRKMLFIGTPLGGIVVFERYTFGENGVFTSNTHTQIKNLHLDMLPDGRLGGDQISNIFGFWSKDGKYTGNGNISEHMITMKKLFDAMV